MVRYSCALGAFLLAFTSISFAIDPVGKSPESGLEPTTTTSLVVFTTTSTTTTTEPQCQFYKATSAVTAFYNHASLPSGIDTKTKQSWRSQARNQGPNCLLGEINKALESGDEVLNNLRNCLRNTYFADGLDVCYATFMLLGKDMVSSSNTLISANWNNPGFCSYGKDAYFPPFTEKSECLAEGIVDGYVHCRESVSYFDSNCNPVSKSAVNAQCGNGDFLGELTFIGYGATPISFLWDESVNLDENISLVDFPLDLSKAGSKWLWKGSEQAPLLVYDPQHTGKIKDASQLFGNWTFGGRKVASLVGSEAKTWSNGFEALKTLDNNGDGVISGDELQPLALWFDKNSDSVSSRGEVKDVISLGIKKIYFNPDSKDPISGDITASLGFEREENGKIFRGSSVDWQSQGAKDKMELLLKQYMANRGGQIKELPSQKSEIKNSDYAEFKPQDIQQRSGTLTGIWRWKFTGENKEDDSAHEGFFVLFDDKIDGVNGYSMVETPFKGGDAASAVIRYYIKGSKSISNGTNQFTFVTEGANGNLINSIAAIQDEKTLVGESKVVIKEANGKSKTITYKWIANKYERGN